MHRADPGERHVADLLPLEVVRRHGALRVLQGRHEQLMPGEGRRFDRVRPARDDLLPRAPRGRARVDGEDPLVGRVERRLDVEDGAVVPEQLVLRLEDIDERDGLRRRLREVDVDELLLPTIADLAVADRDGEVVPVRRDPRVELPRRVIRSLVDDDVLLRRGPQRVEVHLAVVVGLRELLACRGSREAAVVDPFAVAREAWRVVLHVREHVRSIAARIGGRSAGMRRRHVADVPLLPVTTAIGESVGDPRPISRRREPCERQAPVRREGVGVEKNGRSAVESIRREEDRLVLLPRIVDPEVVRASMTESAVRLRARELCEARAECVTPGELGNVRIGELVLGRDPVARLLRVEGLEPAVGVGHLHAVVFFDDVSGPSRRVRPRGRGRRNGGRGHGRRRGRKRSRRGGRGRSAPRGTGENRDEETAKAHGSDARQGRGARPRSKPGRAATLDTAIADIAGPRSPCRRSRES